VRPRFRAGRTSLASITRPRRSGTVAGSTGEGDKRLFGLPFSVKQHVATLGFRAATA